LPNKLLVLDELLVSACDLSATRKALGTAFFSYFFGVVLSFWKEFKFVYFKNLDSPWFSREN